jgi:hypothetical protein
MLFKQPSSIRAGAAGPDHHCIYSTLDERFGLLRVICCYDHNDEVLPPSAYSAGMLGHAGDRQIPRTW